MRMEENSILLLLLLLINKKTKATRYIKIQNSFPFFDKKIYHIEYALMDKYVETSFCMCRVKIATLNYIFQYSRSKNVFLC